jgi:hypothetical protein
MANPTPFALTPQIAVLIAPLVAGVSAVPASGY